MHKILASLIAGLFAAGAFAQAAAPATPATPAVPASPAKVDGTPTRGASASADCREAVGGVSYRRTSGPGPAQEAFS